jgi:cytochrome b561
MPAGPTQKLFGDMNSRSMQQAAEMPSNNQKSGQMLLGDEPEMSDSVLSAQKQFRFGRVQRLLHWTMAGLIFAAIGLGAVSAYLPVGQEPRKSLLELHKSLGFTIFALLLIRIVWRLLTGEPGYRQPLDRLTRLASRAGHGALYVLMLLMPVTGYLFSAAGGYSLPWFGLFQWPRLLPRDKGVAEWGEFLHDRGAWVIAAVILLHLAAVAYHHWVKRDEVLSRMTAR